MKFFETIFSGIFLVNFANFLAEASVHTWGERGYFDRNKLVETTLIEQNSTTPKNHTIIYRYYQDYYHPASYIEINVNCESRGEITRSTSRQWYYGDHKEIYLFTATIRVDNTTNIHANVTIYEKDNLPFTYVLEGGPDNNKSFTYLYATDAFPVVKPNVLTAMGKRQSGDELVYFEARNVLNYNHFPSRAFSYNGKEKDEFITYVRFSLSSRTAIVLVNTSHVGEQEFDAIVYDMNSERFAANFSVFGMKPSRRPIGFLGVVDLS